MRTFDFDHICWGCGLVNEAASGLGDTQPDDGSLAICWSCAAPSVITETLFGLVVNKPDEKELRRILHSEEYLEAYQAIVSAQFPQDAVVALERRAASN